MGMVFELNKTFKTGKKTMGLGRVLEKNIKDHKKTVVPDFGISHYVPMKMACYGKYLTGIDCLNRFEAQ